MLTIAGFSFCVKADQTQTDPKSLWLSDLPLIYIFDGHSILLAADFSINRFIQPADW